MIYGAMNFPVRPVLEEIESISALGFDYLELTMDPPEAASFAIREQKDEILQALNNAGMKLVCHLPSFLFTADLTDRIREASVLEMLDCLETAKELNPLKVVLHPSYITGLGVFVESLAKLYAAESLERIVQKADELELSLCLENMFPRAGSIVNPDEFIPILEQFPSLKITLDIGHANIGSKNGKRNLEFIEKLGDKIGHIHASDNFGKEDNHLPIGAGIINFKKIMKRLRKTGYDDTVTLEIFSNDRNYLRISREKFETILTSSGT